MLSVLLVVVHLHVQERVHLPFRPVVRVRVHQDDLKSRRVKEQRGEREVLFVSVLFCTVCFLSVLTVFISVQVPCPELRALLLFVCLFCFSVSLVTLVWKIVECDSSRDDPVWLMGR